MSFWSHICDPWTSLDFKYEQGSCSERRHGDRYNNTAAVSLSDGWAWYRCNPVKAFWRITMSNSKPCYMHYNNKGILQTFFNLARAKPTTPVHFYALLLCYDFLSIHIPSSCCFLLSNCPSLSMLHHLTSMHPSITLSLSFYSIVSNLEIIYSMTPPSCLKVRLCLIFNGMMKQVLLMQAFSQKNWLLG